MQRLVTQCSAFFHENNVRLIIYRSGVQKMNVRQKYRGFVCVLLGFGIIGLGVCSLAAVRAQIPSQMQVADAGELPELFHNAFDRLITKEISAREPAALDEKQGGTTLVEVGESLNENAVPETYKIMYRLFGKIPLKMVTVSVVPRKQVYVGGTPIGIYLKTDGVMVVETGEIQSADGNVCCPAENIVKSGDYIKAVNGVETDTKERLVECISACGGEDVVLAVDRAGKIMGYDAETGHRIKEPFNQVSWVHSVRKVPDFRMKQCLFGEHLLSDTSAAMSAKPVAVVESEKTALVAALFIPDFIWLATGGMHGCFNSETMQVLGGREVVLFPDLKATEEWRQRLPMLESFCRRATCSDMLERIATGAQRGAGLDIADFLLMEDTPQMILQQMIERNPVLRSLIDAFGLELIDAKKTE